MDLRDFQLITSRPQDLIQVVENVGLLRAQGVEAEALFIPAEWLILFGTVGYNDAHYIEFPFGPCALSFPDTDGDGDPRCDYAGIPFAPNWNATFTPAVTFPLDTIPGVRSIPLPFGDAALEGSLSVLWADQGRNPLLPIDFRNRRESFFLVSSRLGLTSVDQGWSIAVHGENITDTLLNVATLEISGLPDNFAGVPEPGRHFFVQLRYEL